MPMTGAMQVIVVGVLSQSPVEESPGQVVYSILLVLNSTSDNLCDSECTSRVGGLRVNHLE